MAKHGRKPKRNWQTIEIDAVLDLGIAGLAAKDAVTFQVSELATENFIATSVTVTPTLLIEQAAEPNGLSTIMFGVSKSDYNAAEVEAWIENQSGFTRADLIAQEVSRRMIKTIGVFMPEQRPAAAQISVALTEGRPIKTRLNWRILEGTTLAFWIYNGGQVAIVASTGQLINCLGKITGFWED